MNKSFINLVEEVINLSLLHFCFESVCQVDFGNKVDVPNWVSDLNQTLIWESCMVGCESKNGHGNYMC